MNLSTAKIPTLTINNQQEKRQEILNYFYNSYETFEILFTMFKNEDVFYKKSESTRHPMIFYFGHTATFFINKLILANVITKRINPNFESMFAIGVDEMSWDDLNESRYNWPKVDEVREYRKEVRKLVENLIITLPLNDKIEQNDDMWIILMGIEHERIHIETSSVLHRQMPIEYISKIEQFPICKVDNKVVQNQLITIEEQEIRVGKDITHNLYGWDNEYGVYNTKVPKFQVSKYLVSNAEYFEFVKDNGYNKKEFWDEEGKEFLKNYSAKHPTFWIKQPNGEFKYRTIMEIIDMPYSWPVDVNVLEAMAFCRWKSTKEKINYTLPSEEQYYSIHKRANIQEIPLGKGIKANINLNHFASASPVDMFAFRGNFSSNDETASASFNDIYDVIGNVWQWTRTPIYPFDGFKVHPVYDDFSVPTFDNKHNLLKGGSFISTGNEIIKHSRYAFRRHFYQHSGFRYVIGDEQLDIKLFKNEDKFINDEINKHTLCDKITKIFKHVKTFTTKYKKKSALEIGCSVGKGTIELSKIYTSVTGVDTTSRIIKEAMSYKNSFENINNIEFWQVDPSNLKPHFKNYDLIILNEILNRIYSPISLLNDLIFRINSGGILIIISQKSDDLSSLNKSFKLVSIKDIENKNISLWERI